MIEVAGSLVGEMILLFANLIVDDYWPGFISLVFLLVALCVIVFIALKSASTVSAYKDAIACAKTSSFTAGLDLATIEERLAKSKKGPGASISTGFKEFRETLVESGTGDTQKVRNSIRPSVFLNADELGFTMRGWRFVPGLFVSAGLLFTFLGLVAVLSSTADILPKETNLDQSGPMDALRILLVKASAKFTISLTGLFCSIFINFSLKLGVSRIEHHAANLADTLEKRMDFISLEGLADQQLSAIKDQTADMKELNTRLIAELTEPLGQVAESSMQNIGTMVGQMGDSITSGLGDSLEKVADRIDNVSGAMTDIGNSLQEAVTKFDSSLKSSTQALDSSVKRLDEVTQKLTDASKNVGEATPAILDTIKATNSHSLQVAEGSVNMVNAAKTTIAEEKETVTEAMHAVRELIGAFEARAAAYDGQLEKAFQTYQQEVATTIDRLSRHGAGVQEQFAEALGTLRTVIEDAKAFEPESGSKAKSASPDEEVLP